MRNLLTVVAVTFAFLIGADATGQTLTFEKAKVNLKKQSLDYQASIAGFSITNPGDYLVVLSLFSMNNGEAANPIVSLTEFNDEHLEGGGNFGDCENFTDIRVKKASLNIDDDADSDDDDANVLKIKGKLCSFSCDSNINNFEVSLTLFNTVTFEFDVQQMPLTHLLPKECS